MQNVENSKPRENKTVYRCTLLAGMLMIGAALLIALSVNNLVVGAGTGDINKNYSASVVIHWALAGTLMFLVGVWVLFLAAPLKKWERRAWWQAIIISISFISFGSSFWYRYPGSVHLPGFILLGLILLVPLIINAGKFKSNS